MAIGDCPTLEFREFSNIRDDRSREELADWMAFVVANDGVIGIFQGEGETGPRALGHRSLLSNPRNERTLETLNSRVKRREKIRQMGGADPNELSGRPHINHEAAREMRRAKARWIIRRMMPDNNTIRLTRSQ